ncbi:MAG: hypothetical protein ABIP51_02435, partial [Bacteroidia bacterium]
MESNISFCFSSIICFWFKISRLAFCFSRKLRYAKVAKAITISKIPQMLKIIIFCFLLSAIARASFFSRSNFAAASFLSNYSGTKTNRMTTILNQV